MGYFVYYAVILALTVGLRYPWLLAAALLFFFLRHRIPDPFVLARTFGRIRKLRAQIDANPSNVTARRDLARVYLERLRPRAALTLLEEARARDTQNPELLFLTGVARFRSGDVNGCLELLGQAIALDARIGFGEPYLVAGDAHMKLARFDDAEDAYEHFVEANASSVEGAVKLARARKKRGDRQGARDAYADALTTWSQIPGFRRRGQYRYWFAARLESLFV